MKTVQLRRFFNVKGGTTPSTSESSYWGGSIPWVTPADLSTDGIDYVSDSNSKVTIKGLKENNLLLSEKGWVVFSNRAPIGKVAICGTPLCTNQGCKLIYPNNEKQYNTKYLAYWLISNKAKLNLLGSGTTFNEISTSTLLSFRIPLVDIHQQNKIVDLLDRRVKNIDDVIKEKTIQLEKLSEYRQSLITQAVTKGLDPKAEMKDSGVEWIGKIPAHWNIAAIKHCGQYTNGLTYSPQDLVADGTPVLRSTNVQNGQLDINDLVFVRSEVAVDSMLKAGDVLICSRNGSAKLIGKCAYISEEDKFAFGAFMMVFRSKLKKFGFYILNSALFSYYKPQFGTSTINQLTGKSFGEMLIPIPPDSEMTEIAIHLDNKIAQILKTENSIKNAIELLLKYRTSLISAAVTGKIDISEVNQ